MNEDYLHPWFYGGAAPAPFVPKLELAQHVAATVVYPMWALSEVEKQRLRADEKPVPTAEQLDAELRDAGNPRKSYVKSAKVAQMRQWLDALYPHRFKIQFEASMYERDFLNKLYQKFNRYRVVKWTTKSQYDFLARLAARYLGASYIADKARR